MTGLLTQFARRLTLADERDRVTRDLDDEFEFHVESLASDLQEQDGLDVESARARAAARFGDADRYRRRCLRIALEERLMMQRVNAVLSTVLIIAVAALFIRNVIAERERADALQALSAQIATLQSQQSAVQDWRQRAETEAARAQFESEKAEAVQSFMTSMLTKIDPVAGDDLAIADILDKATVNVGFQADPEVRRELLETIEATRRRLENPPPGDDAGAEQDPAAPERPAG